MMTDPGELIPSDEAAKQLRQKPATLVAWRNQNRGPAYFRIGRRVFYAPADIARFIATQRHEPEAV